MQIKNYFIYNTLSDVLFFDNHSYCFFLYASYKYLSMFHTNFKFQLLGI